MIADWLEIARINAPMLLVTAPLVGAALTAAIVAARASWTVAVLAALVTAAFAIDLGWRGLFGAVTTGISRHDGAGLFVAPLLASAGVLVMLALGALNKDVTERTAPFSFALVLVLIAGWCGALVASDLVSLFLAVEVAWLAGIGVAAINAERDRAALSGALRMLIVGGVGSALMLLGVGLVAHGVGETRLLAFAETRIAVPEITAIGVALILLALAIKAGAAPFHFWVGAAFGRTGAALALGALAALGAVAVLVRVAGFAFAAPPLGSAVAALLTIVGAASVVIGSLHAAGARNLKRLAAYAGVAQIGCILLSAALGSPAGLAAALVQMFALLAAALALFGGGAAIGGVALPSLDGLGRRAPLASVAISAAALSLMGAPLTVGFLGRWRMIEAGVGVGWWWAACAVVAASLAGVFYAGRLIDRLYFRKSSAPYVGEGGAWRWLFAPMLGVAILSILLGLEPVWLLAAADAAAARIMGLAP